MDEQWEAQIVLGKEAADAHVSQNGDVCSFCRLNSSPVLAKFTHDGGAVVFVSRLSLARVMALSDVDVL